MIGAIEFLRKAKAIYSTCEMKCSTDFECPISNICNDGRFYNLHDVNESELVRKVMDYRLEDTDAERN